MFRGIKREKRELMFGELLNLRGVVSRFIERLAAELTGLVTRAAADNQSAVLAPSISCQTKCSVLFIKTKILQFSSIIIQVVKCYF